MFEYTEILDLQLLHVHLTVSITVKRHQIQTSIVIRVSANKHRLIIVLDRVCHFRPIPIHRFFCCQLIPMRYRYASRADVPPTWRSVADRSKAPDAAATNNSGGGQRGGGCL